MPLGHNLLQSSLCSIVHPMLTTEVNDRFALRCIEISSAPAEKIALVDLFDLHTAQAWRRSRKSQNYAQLVNIFLNLTGFPTQRAREPGFDTIVQIPPVAEGVDFGHLFRREGAHHRIPHRRIPLPVGEFVGRLAPVCIGSAIGSLHRKGALFELPNFRTAQAWRRSRRSQNQTQLLDIAVNLSGILAQGSREPVFDAVVQIIFVAEGVDVDHLLRRESTHRRILYRRIPLPVGDFIGRHAPVCIGRATASLQPKGAIVELPNFHTAQARRISCSSQTHVQLHDVAVNLSGIHAQGSNEPVFDVAVQIILGAEGGDFGGLLRREGAQRQRRIPDACRRPPLLLLLPLRRRRRREREREREREHHRRGPSLGLRDGGHCEHLHLNLLLLVHLIPLILSLRKLHLLQLLHVLRLPCLQLLC
mmetsp:Transcript_47160/g.134247  ORF Transcript_47160/g.134247 Transcript_47160/m.134247 type:complete len:419 (-) Transcript_47160:813-2069(-)